MLQKLTLLFNSLLHGIESFNRETWLGVFAVLVVIGFFCMRGFTTRM